jgi:hypothetical protein
MPHLMVLSSLLVQLVLILLMQYQKDLWVLLDRKQLRLHLMVL